MSTLYASFRDASAAERAAGALLDQGASSKDISIVANEAYHAARITAAQQEAKHAESSAKTGISPTTAGDVTVGAVKGGAVGLGVGMAAAMAALFVPGLGLVVGGGALATAMAAGLAAAVAGTAVGGVVGYLRDQGVPEEMATRYSADFSAGGAILAVAIPSGSLTAGEMEGILAKYGALNVATYNSAKVLIDDPSVQASKVPLAVDNPNIDPIAVTPVVGVTEIPDGVEVGEGRLAVTEVVPTTVDPITGIPTSAVVVDPLTQFERPVAVDAETGMAVVPPVSPITRPVTGVVVDPVTGLPIVPPPATPATAIGMEAAEEEIEEDEEPVIVAERHPDVDLY